MRVADQLCDGKRTDVLDCLAAAYAEAGRFPNALATLRQGVRPCHATEVARVGRPLATWIALYEAGKAYHQPPPGSRAAKR